MAGVHIEKFWQDMESLMVRHDRGIEYYYHKYQVWYRAYQPLGNAIPQIEFLRISKSLNYL